MRADWLKRQGSDQLILFFAGWAVDTTAIRHLQGDDDVLVLCDYRDEALPDALLVPYRKISVVAYSMGVAVAGRHLPDLRPHRAIAVCGSPDPRNSIGPGIYDATIAQLGTDSLARFARRAGAPVPQNPDIAALADELRGLGRRPAAQNPAFDRVIAATQDRIFPLAAMKAAWPGYRIELCEGGHTPFAQWQTWQDLTG